MYAVRFVWIVDECERKRDRRQTLESQKHNEIKSESEYTHTHTPKNSKKLCERQKKLTKYQMRKQKEPNHERKKEWNELKTYLIQCNLTIFHLGAASTINIQAFANYFFSSLPSLPPKQCVEKSKEQSIVQGRMREMEWKKERSCNCIYTYTIHIQWCVCVPYVCVCCHTISQFESDPFFSLPIIENCVVYNFEYICEKFEHRSWTDCNACRHFVRCNFAFLFLFVCLFVWWSILPCAWCVVWQLI